MLQIEFPSQQVSWCISCIARLFSDLTPSSNFCSWLPPVLNVHVSTRPDYSESWCFVVSLLTKQSHTSKPSQIFLTLNPGMSQDSFKPQIHRPLFLFQASCFSSYYWNKQVKSHDSGACVPSLASCKILTKGDLTFFFIY